MRLFKLPSEERKRIILFVKIGVAYVLLRAFGELFSNTDQYISQFFNHCWLIIYLIALNYLFFERFLKHMKFSFKGIIKSIGIIFIYLMLASYGLYAWMSLGIGIMVYTDVLGFPFMDDDLQYLTAYTMSTLFFFGVIRHFHDFRHLKITTQQLKIEKQLAELNYLKSQTNPHFLFNTLNNIYSLARDKSELAPESIMRLSKILRYMLYESTGDYVSIEQELKIIHGYIELEKLRYDETLRVNYNHDIEDMKQSIPPLLLIPLIENAFKHGVSESRSNPFVDIHLSISDRNLCLIVKNSCDDSVENMEITENIGLSNLRRQLEIQFKQYTLECKHLSGYFLANLTINLSSHV